MFTTESNIDYNVFLDSANISFVCPDDGVEYKSVDQRVMAAKFYGTPMYNMIIGNPEKYMKLADTFGESAKININKSLFYYVNNFESNVYFFVAQSFISKFRHGFAEKVSETSDYTVFKFNIEKLNVVIKSTKELQTTGKLSINWKQPKDWDLLAGLFRHQARYYKARSDINVLDALLNVDNNSFLTAIDKSSFATQEKQYLTSVLAPSIDTIKEMVQYDLDHWPYRDYIAEVSDDVNLAGENLVGEIYDKLANRYPNVLWRNMYAYTIYFIQKHTGLLTITRQSAHINQIRDELVKELILNRANPLADTTLAERVANKSDETIETVKSILASINKKERQIIRQFGYVDEETGKVTITPAMKSDDPILRKIQRDTNIFALQPDIPNDRDVIEKLEQFESEGIPSDEWISHAIDRGIWNYYIIDNIRDIVELYAEKQGQPREIPFDTKFENNVTIDETELPSLYDTMATGHDRKTFDGINLGNMKTSFLHPSFYHEFKIGNDTFYSIIYYLMWNAFPSHRVQLKNIIESITSQKLSRPTAEKKLDENLKQFFNTYVTEYKGFESPSFKSNFIDILDAGIAEFYSDQKLKSKLINVAMFEKFNVESGYKFLDTNNLWSVRLRKFITDKNIDAVAEKRQLAFNLRTEVVIPMKQVKEFAKDHNISLPKTKPEIVETLRNLGYDVPEREYHIIEFSDAPSDEKINELVSTVPGFFVPTNQSEQNEFLELYLSGKAPYVAKSNTYFVTESYKGAAKQFIFSRMPEDFQFNYTYTKFIKTWSKWLLERSICYRLYRNERSSVQYNTIISKAAATTVSKLLNLDMNLLLKNKYTANQWYIASLSSFAHKYSTTIGDHMTLTNRAAAIFVYAAEYLAEKFNISPNSIGLKNITDTTKRLKAQIKFYNSFQEMLSSSIHSINFQEEWTRAFHNLSKNGITHGNISYLLPLNTLSVADLMMLIKKSKVDDKPNLFNVSTFDLDMIIKMFELNNSGDDNKTLYVIASIVDYTTRMYNEGKTILAHKLPKTNDIVPSETASLINVTDNELLKEYSRYTKINEIFSRDTSLAVNIPNLYLNPINTSVEMHRIAALVNTIYRYTEPIVIEKMMYIDVDGSRWWRPETGMTVWAYGQTDDGFDFNTPNTGIISKNVGIIDWNTPIDSWKTDHGFKDYIVLIRYISDEKNIPFYRLGNINFNWETSSRVNYGDPSSVDRPPIDTSVYIEKMLMTDHRITDKPLRLQPNSWVLHFIDAVSINTSPNGITDRLWKMYNIDLYSTRRDIVDKHADFVRNTPQVEKYNGMNNPLIMSIVFRENFDTLVKNYNPMNKFLIKDISVSDVFNELVNGPFHKTLNLAIRWKYDPAFVEVYKQPGQLGKIVYISKNKNTSTTVFPWLKNAAVWSVQETIPREKIDSSKQLPEPITDQKNIGTITEFRDVANIIAKIESPDDIWNVISSHIQVYNWNIDLRYDPMFISINFDSKANQIIYWSQDTTFSLNTFPFLSHSFFSVRNGWRVPINQLGDHVINEKHFKIEKKTGKEWETKSTLISVVGWKQTGVDQLRWLTPQKFGEILNDLVKKYQLNTLSIIWPFGDGLSLRELEPYINYSKLSGVDVTLYQITDEFADISVSMLPPVIDLDNVVSFADQIAGINSPEVIKFYSDPQNILPKTFIGGSELTNLVDTLEDMTGNDYNADAVYVEEEAQNSDIGQETYDDEETFEEFQAGEFERFGGDDKSREKMDDDEY